MKLGENLPRRNVASSEKAILFNSCSDKPCSHRDMVTWKRLNTETTQHWNRSKLRRNHSKTILRRFHDFFKLFGNPSKFKFWGVSYFFDQFPRIVYPFPLYFFQIFSRDYPIFLRGFPIFLVRFLIFLIRYPFFQKSHFVDRFPQILGPFLHILIRFRFLKKNLKLLKRTK